MTQQSPLTPLPAPEQRATGQTIPPRLVTRFTPHGRRATLESAIRAGSLRQTTAVELLAPEALPGLASLSLWLLLVAAAIYGGLVTASLRAWSVGPLFGNGPVLLRLLLLVGLNIAGYVVMIPLHEAAHALVILALGGRPRFGLRLPLAAYCTAPNQLFLRDGYLAVALAPLILLSAISIVIAALSPVAGAALLLFFAGNVSGAVGDLQAVRSISQRPASTLIADTETGYITYEVMRAQM